jgi:thioredoxin:protein disulfide reductase
MTRVITKSRNFCGARLCAVLVLLFLVTVTPHGLSAQQEAPVHPGSVASAGMAPKGVANVQWYVSLEPVPLDSDFAIAAVVEIPAAYHMNAHKVSDEFLIPTTLTAELPFGIHQVDVIYPPGKLLKFAFLPTPLNVYQGKVTILLKLRAAADAKIGSVEFPLTLRYQACNESTCFPPVKVPLRGSVKVADAGAPSRAMHPEIFGKQ